MSEHESDASSFDTTNSSTQTNIFLKLSPNGHIFADWSDLPRHPTVRQCVIHYKSLNNNRSHALRVSHKKNNGYLKKIETGHRYEVHVCAVDNSNKILASTQRAQIQTIACNEAPRLRVTKSSPDSIWLEWEKPDEVKLSDITTYKIKINGLTQICVPPTENRYVINDGKSGERYIFQIEMIRNDGKKNSSIPVSINWPCVTIPKCHAIVNGSDELIFCWGDSISINDGNIESYTLHLYDSKENLLSKCGPYSPECRQIWIKDVAKGVYNYILEIKLANSNKSIYSIPMKIECGRESRLPILTYNYTDSNNEKQLFNMIYHLINIRDNMKSKRFFDKCDNQLQQILSILTHLTDSIRLNLMIESNSNKSALKTYQLIIDNQECSKPIPGSVKEYPLELPRRDRPYEIAISVIPDFDGIKSKKIVVEASGQLSFFCMHFDQRQPAESCFYVDTLHREKQLKQSIHQGLLKTPQIMNNIEVYDINENKIIRLPSEGRARRLSILFFYINQCIPSMNHLEYFSNYASNNRAQYNYLSINCTQMDIDDLKETNKDLTDIQCYTDFSSEDFEYEEKHNDKPIHEILEIDGVPMYFILDFSNRIVWKGRLCIQDQTEYDSAMNHIITEVNQIKCSPDKCKLCQYCSMDENRVKSELNTLDRDLQYLLQQRFSQSAKKQQDGEKQNKKRQIVSMKNISNNKKDNRYH
ncbi:unnamed protein product [Adineta steineri]|uniref:Fibronectin type-III domain-containing protein n=1 Tax=Adineta steineri TaxID=433720 RepID=A0A814HAS5_9BILA|nr:unnamed protein product [Adineta steineri]